MRNRAIVTLLFLAAAVSLCVQQTAAGAEKLEVVEQWGTFELALEGPSAGNPFEEVTLSAVFETSVDSIEVPGFYDGDGVYRVRFMPAVPAIWRYETVSNLPILNGLRGQFICSGRSPGNHGPVQVADTFRFAYADGTPHLSVGTTCYAWTHQDEALQEQTLETLKNAPFNKLRMCVFPKDYTYNKNEPPRYPFPRDEDGNNDFSRFNPEHFQHFEKRVAQLRDLGIEADIILLHDYDRWGYAKMDVETTVRYIRYVVARLFAYRNVWWSLANEYDLLEHYSEEDWDRFFQVVQEADPYEHLRSIHNMSRWYDHTKPWVTHVSCQTSNFEDAGRLRSKYGKPVVFDECRYEGNVPQGWGNLTPQRMTWNFWAGSLAGCYVGHGETYKHPGDVLWWSKGGVLHGESPERINFLKEYFESIPYQEMTPDFSSPGNYILAKPGELYLVLFGGSDAVALQLPGDQPYKVDAIDIWAMSSEPVGTAAAGDITLTPVGPNQVLRLTPYAPGEPLRPDATATAEPQRGPAPLKVQFSAPPGLQSAWEFGDGTGAAEAKPVHEYHVPGQYTVSLCVTDAAGQSSRTALPVTVLPAPTEDLDGAGAWPGVEEGLELLWPGAALEARNGAVLDAQRGMALGQGVVEDTGGAGERLLAATREHNTFALEVAFTPENTEQKGPARIVTFSTDHSSRLFTLGQEGEKLVLRLRTSENPGNAIDPTVTLCRLEAGSTMHLVVSYFPGLLAAYVDGERVLETSALRGDFSNWEEGHELIFGDERVGGRAWSGTLHGVAIYSRFIGEDEAAGKYRLWRARSQAE